MSNHLSPRQAAGMLGVSESTMRRWCDSGQLTITRTIGGHRRVQRQSLLRFARERGLDVLDIAPLEIIGGRLADLAELRGRFYELLTHGSDEQVQQFARGIVERTGDCAGLCDDIIAPAMQRVGLEWSQHRLRIFREHAASQRAAAAITAVRGMLAPVGSDAPAAVCAALVDDPYSLAPAMCSLVFASAGFRVTLLGPDTPAQEILQAAVELSAHLVAVSISTAPTSPDDLASLCTRAGELGIRVALGGPMLTAELRKQLTPDFFGDTMAHLSSYANRHMQMLRNSVASAHR